MISVNDVNKFSNLLSNIFFYGFSHAFSFVSIEEKILNARCIQDIENGDSSFLIKETNDDLVSEIYDCFIEEKELLKTNTISLWLGELYTKLFFTFNKSFSFLFLYLPINKGIDMFPLYHEMDMSQSVDYFKNLISKNSIVSLLLKKHDMTANQLSVLTQINHNTILSYTRNNDFIYNAKFESLFKISQIFNVNINIFARKLNNFTNSEMYDFDKTNSLYRLYLGYFISSYFDSEIAEEKYQLKDEILVSLNSNFVVKWLKPTILKESQGKSLYNLASNYKQERKDISKTILSIFYYDEIGSDYSLFANLQQLGFKKLIVIDGLNFIEILRSGRIIHKRFNNALYEAMINQAKNKVNGDFAI